MSIEEKTNEIAKKLRQEKAKSLIESIDKAIERIARGSWSSLLHDDLKRLKDGIIDEIKFLVPFEETKKVKWPEARKHMEEGNKARAYDGAVFLIDGCFLYPVDNFNSLTLERLDGDWELL